MNRLTQTVFCIDDEHDHAELLRIALMEVPNRNFRFIHECDGDCALDRLAAEQIDLIFLDYQLGSMTGLELLEKLRKSHVEVPVIMLTAQGNEYIATSVIRSGADEYLVKSDLRPDIVASTIQNAEDHAYKRVEGNELRERVRKLEDLSNQLSENNSQLSAISRIDSLTQVLNRRAWEEAIELEHSRSTRYHHTYCVIMLDVDHFKAYNDSAGHPAGDECLRSFAKSILSTCRDVDSVCRYGGEEFIILSPETDLAGGTRLAERLAQNLRDLSIAHTGFDDDRVITASFGVAGGPTLGWNEVIEAADQALYKAKAEGRDRIRSTPLAA